MASLAEVFVPVRADMKRFGGDVRRGAGKGDIEKAGKAAGDSFVKSFGSGLKRLTGLAAAALGGRALIQGGKEAVGLASDLNETVSKSNVIFGKNGAEIRKWSAGALTSLGMTQQQALNSAASFGDMFLQIGFTGKQATKMSKQVVQMSTDFASFNNLDTADVQERISAAFRGEYDSLQAIIPNISAARVQTEALAMTGKKNASQLTAQEKAAATLAIVNHDGARAMGDFGRTMQGQANQQRIAAAQTLTLKTTIGQALLPTVNQATQLFTTKFMPPLIAYAKVNGPALNASLQGATTSVGNLLSVLVSGDFTGSIFGQGEDSRVVDFLFKAREGTSGWGESIKGLDKQALSDMLGRALDAGEKLIPVVQEFIKEMPSLDTSIGLVVKTLEFFASHTDTLIKLMPLIVAGLVAWKLAQMAANAAALLAVPLKVADIASTRQLAKATRELAASRAADVVATGGEAAATGANTVADTAATAAKGRGRIATLAMAGASKVAALAQTALSAGLRLVGVAVRFALGPIGLIITAIGLATAAVIYLYKHNETFRNIVNAVWRSIQSTISGAWNKVLKPVFGFIDRAFDVMASGARTAIRFVINNFLSMVQAVLDGSARAFGWVPKLGDKLRTAAREFGNFRQSVNRQLDAVKDTTINVKPVFDKATMSLASAGRRAKGGPGFEVHGPGTPTNDGAGLFALSRKEWVINSAVSQNQGFQRMKALNDGKAEIVPVKGLARGGPATFDVRSLIPSERTSQVFAQTTRLRAVRSMIPLMIKAVTDFAKESGGAVLQWVRTQVGKPYVWGGVGPRGYDCSGLVSAAINKAFGRNPYHRLGSTGSMPWSMFAPGPGRFMVGWFKGNPGHTAATVNGVNIESAGGVGVRMGRGARGANSSLFTNRMHVKGLRAGGYTGDAPFDIYDPRGMYYPGRTALQPLRDLLGDRFTADSGVTLAPGLNLLHNRTGGPEPLARTDQPLDLSPATIKALGRVMAAAMAEVTLKPRHGPSSAYALELSNT